MKLLENFEIIEEHKKPLEKVEARDFFNFIREYDISKNMLKVGFVNLFYYIDAKGDFRKKPNYPHRLIARAIFESLETKRKLQVISYIEGIKK